MIKPTYQYLLALAATLPSAAFATTVQFQTVMGDVTVELFDESTPNTVANFLRYVDEQKFNDTLIHRSVSNFVIQGGGYVYTSDGIESITTHEAVINEPVFANVRGTIAMAKIGGNPNSATSQWFFNLRDNSSNLDNQNGGFTVFGQVTEGMDVIDAIANVQRYQRSGFTDIPLRDWMSSNTEQPTDENYILIEQITILDAAADTASDLNPVTTTRGTNQPTAPSTPSSSSGGASLPPIFLGFMLLATSFARRVLSRKRTG